jgi:formate/nitrite transporter FocA (FNT family)
VALMMAIVFTNGFTTPPDVVGQKIGMIGESRTVGYAAHGAAGMLTLFIRGVLCNWMVSTGVVGAMVSTSVSGKVIAMWMPIMLFFGMAFEHSVVNMFLFPSGLMLGGNFSIMDYMIWNEIPTVLGNLVGGLAFVGLTLYSTHARTGAKRNVDQRSLRIAAE